MSIKAFAQNIFSQTALGTSFAMAAGIPFGYSLIVGAGTWAGSQIATIGADLLFMNRIRQENNDFADFIERSQYLEMIEDLNKTPHGKLQSSDEWVQERRDSNPAFNKMINRNKSKAIIGAVMTVSAAFSGSYQGYQITKDQVTKRLIETEKKEISYTPTNKAPSQALNHSKDYMLAYKL